MLAFVTYPWPQFFFFLLFDSFWSNFNFNILQTISQISKQRHCYISLWLWYIWIFICHSTGSFGCWRSGPRRYGRHARLWCRCFEPVMSLFWGLRSRLVCGHKISELRCWGWGGPTQWPTPLHKDPLLSPQRFAVSCCVVLDFSYLLFIQMDKSFRFKPQPCFLFWVAWCHLHMSSY